jgi:uncharacterized FlaG/YvyC family protein
MNVGPAQFSSGAIDLHEPVRQVRASQPQRASLANEPVKAVSKPQDAVSVPSLPQDEVKVKWDTSAHLMVYQFVNQQSGALVLQVPSREVLNLTRGIHESLQEETLQKESLRQQSLRQESSRKEKEAVINDITEPASAVSGTAGHEGKRANGN